MAYQPLHGNSPGEASRSASGLYSPFTEFPSSPKSHPRKSDFQLLVEEKEDEDGDDEPIVDWVPFIPEFLCEKTEMEIDDKDSTYILIFPREKEAHHGTVDSHAVRENPKEDWLQIFKVTKGQVPAILKRGPVGEAKFQELVRDKMLEIFRDSGLKVKTSESIDGDEVFVRLSLDREGHMIRRMAELFYYRVPFKRSCYEREPMIGPYNGGVPRMNDEGVEVLAYTEYRQVLDNFLQDFTRVDEVRLISMQLNSHVRLHALEAHNIISGHFPGSDWQEMQQLRSSWASLHSITVMPTPRDEEAVRRYFGEEIGFFFRWLRQYIQMLWLLAGVTIVLTLRWVPDFCVTMLGRDIVKIGFGVFLVLWEAAFMKMNKANSAKAVQAWGMEAFESTEATLPTYNPDFEGTQRMRLRQIMLQCAVVAYMVWFTLVIAAMSASVWYLTRSGYDGLARQMPTVESVLIKFLSFTWRKLASPLVAMGNHRTQTRFNNALITNLSMVKLFVSLYPFFYIAVIKRWLEITRGESLSDAAKKVYRYIGWPEGINVQDIGAYAHEEQYIPVANLDFLKGYWYVSGNETCIQGCYPVSCNWEQDGAIGTGGARRLACETNCLKSIKHTMTYLFFIQLGSCILFTFVPIVLRTWHVLPEIRKARAAANGKKVRYSFIQLQAKSWRAAKYAFQDWGGSYVEDFLEMAVSHALLACFGMCAPLSALAGVVCISIQYRCLAFRMTNVTCRPFPRGSTGIGLWAAIFDFISFLSVFFNVILAILMMLPFRDWQLAHQLLAFCVMEKALLLLRDVLCSLLPSTPAEVTFIQDYNNEFKKTLVKRKCASEEEKVSYKDLDIGLAPRSWRAHSDASSSSSDDSAITNGWWCHPGGKCMRRTVGSGWCKRLSSFFGS